MTTSPLAGLWTSQALLEWLKSIGVPHDPKCALRIGPRWPERVDRVGLVTMTPGSSASEFEEPWDRWPGFQLRFRGRQRTDADRDAESLSLGSDRLIRRARMPVTVPAEGGHVRLLGVQWSSTPSRLDPLPDSGERVTWSATYLIHVIEEL